MARGVPVWTRGGRTAKQDELRIVVMGASAGGVEALTKVVAPLPSGLNAALFVVMHRTPTGDSLLPGILSRAGKLPALHAADGDPIEPGRIYIAPPDLHMLIGAGHVHLLHGPKENGFRPAVDPLFRTAADVYRDKTIGVILSGGLTDGAEGLRSIVACGGFAIVQDPQEAPFHGMPASALELGPVDFTLPVSRIGPTIADVVNGRIEKAMLPEPPPGPDLYVDETMGGKQTAYTCPECHGILWEVGEISKQYRCRVGHAFSMSSLVEAQDDGLERALFAALRTLEESGSLSRRLAEGANKRHHHLIAHRFTQRALEKERHAAVLRDLLYNPGRRLAAVEIKGAKPKQISAKSEAGNGRAVRTRRRKAVK